jgi:hypothetical protein
MIKVTLDTSILPAQDLIEAAKPFPCEFATVTVTHREVEGTRFEVHLQGCDSVFEMGLINEGRVGKSVVVSEMSAQRLNDILKIISNGSFPRSRERLSKNQLHQLRDALIMEAHIRSGRDVFVTKDAKAFVDYGKREALAAKFGVRIMSRDEFRRSCSDGTLIGP